MKRVRWSVMCGWAVVVLLMVTGLAKFLWPESGTKLIYSENWQYSMAGLEMCVAVGLAVVARTRRLLLISCVIASGIGVVIHVLAMFSGRSCGCLGSATPSGWWPLLLPCALGYFSCEAMLGNQRAR